MILDTLENLPPAQREVLVLRDFEGLAAPELCNLLGVTDTRQRLLLGPTSFDRRPFEPHREHAPFSGDVK